MENNTDVTFMKLSLNLSPMWKNEPLHLRHRSSPLNKSLIENKKPLSFNNELDKYREKLGRGQKQSPIVKAFNNIDDFYRSIRPSSVKKKKVAKEKEKFEPSLSFQSKKSSEDIEFLSGIIDIKQLEIFNEIMSEESVKLESQLYQTALKSLYEKLSLIYNKRKIHMKTLNLLKNDGLVKED